MSDKMDRHDADGNPCTLDALCRKEPAWAANIIRHMERKYDLLLAEMREELDTVKKVHDSMRRKLRQPLQ